MGDVSGFHYGFCLGKYSDVYAMKDDTAREFLRQFRVFLWQKEATANKYKVLGWRHNDIGIGEIDNDLGYPEFKDCNDSNGDHFIRSIIDQRNDMIAKYDKTLRSAAEDEEREIERKKDAIRADFEWAMERTKQREEQQDEEAFQKRNRMDAANSMIQADLAKRKKLQKQRALYKEAVEFNRKILAAAKAKRKEKK
jgi:hypothetical protein